MTWRPEALAVFLVRVPGVAPGPQGTAACFHQLIVIAWYSVFSYSMVHTSTSVNKA